MGGGVCQPPIDSDRQNPWHLWVRKLLNGMCSVNDIGSPAQKGVLTELSCVMQRDLGELGPDSFELVGRLSGSSSNLISAS